MASGGPNSCVSLCGAGGSYRLLTRGCFLPILALSCLQSVGSSADQGMCLQRIVASLLLSVLLLTPLAPAALATAQPIPQHCVRQPLVRDAAPSGMHCHEAAAHSHHSMASGTESTSTSRSGHQFRSNGCCTNHDCCNSTVRAQWAQFVPAVAFTAAELVQIASVAVPVSPRVAPRFDTNSGRAPPAL